MKKNVSESPEEKFFFQTHGNIFGDRIKYLNMTPNFSHLIQGKALGKIHFDEYIRLKYYSC